MEIRILNSRIKTLLASPPTFAAYTPTSAEHLAWLAQAHALLHRWSPNEAASMQTAMDFISSSALRDINIAKVFGTLHRAVSAMDLSLSNEAGQAFGPGAVYDFFKALKGLVSSASKSLLIVDPYVDISVFDTYLSDIPTGVNVRLLLRNSSTDLKQAIEKFISQHRINIEVKKNGEFHDRIVIVDTADCWVLGQSIKNAAQSMPTYLAPLSLDVGAMKIKHYEDIWRKATPL